MRDDIEGLFNNLVHLTEKKRKHLENIHVNEIQIRFLLKTDNIEELLLFIEKDKEIFDKINALDFDIEAVKSEICGITGIETHNFEGYFLDRDEKLICELKSLNKKIDNMLTTLIAERDKLIRDMNKELGNIKRNILSFSNMLKLKKDLI